MHAAAHLLDVTLNGVIRRNALFVIAWQCFRLREMEPLGKMIAYKRSFAAWRLRTRTISLGARTLVMGIVNITPDSFSDGGLFLDPKRAIAHALNLLDEGADLLDLGAESTRPGSRAGNAPDSLQAPTVSAEEEQARLLPVLEGILKARPDAIVSVDTYKAATARSALQAGAEIVNDVSGFSWDAEMAAVCAEFRAGIVLMHTRGRPEEWRTQPQLAPDALARHSARGPCREPFARGNNSESRRKPSSSIPDMDSASASMRTTPCSPARPSCWRWAVRCWPASAANPSSAARSRPFTMTRASQSKRAKRQAWPR